MMQEYQPPTESLSFEKVWAMFQETSQKMNQTDKQIKELGKQIGGDILTQKRTILILLAVEQVGQAPIEEGFAITEISEKMNYFQKIFNQAAVQEQTQERIAYHHEKALQILKSIKGNTVYLEEIIQQLMERKK
jgi:geranylgeranyl diphosphate synthase type II